MPRIGFLGHGAVEPREPILIYLVGELAGLIARSKASVRVWTRPANPDFPRVN